MPFENLLVNTEQGTQLITINRPDKLNALNKKTMQEIAEAIKLASENNEVKGIIFTGSGTKAFVAGADISEFSGFNAVQGKAFAAEGHAVFNAIENCTKPVIAAINGFALGGGCELAMACHIRIASDNAKMGLPEVNLGLIPGYGGTQRLIQLVGKGKALELLMTTDMVAAEEARQLGLVNHVTPQEQLIPKCKELLEKIKTKSPHAIKKIISCVNAHFHKGIGGFNTEIEEFGACCSTEDFKEGTAAFLEKRKASFKGK